MRSLVEQMKILATRAPLYDGRTRELTRFWEHALIGLVQDEATSAAATDLFQEMFKRAPSVEAQLVDVVQRMSLYL